jgi:hypothetical protein
MKKEMEFLELRQKKLGRPRIAKKRELIPKLARFDNPEAPGPYNHISSLISKPARLISWLR